MEGTGTIYILFCSCLLAILMVCSAADTLTANQTLCDGQTIVSARGEFEMGFCSPKGNPMNRYFGIWYNKISNGTVIWVANRESPISNSSGVVRVISRGIVVSINQSTDSIWMSNSSRSVKNSVAQLLDTGNLVFRDKNEQQNFEWQSFDHPVDNVLPGMKWGYDLATGVDRYPVSWKNDDDPAPGNYIHRMDKNGYPQLIFWKDSVPWHKTGPWVGSRFSGNPIEKPNGIFTPHFVITEKEAYNVFHLINSSESPITRLTVTPAGISSRYIWNRGKQDWTQYLSLQVSGCDRYGCDRYGVCGINSVCNVSKSPSCECMDGFDPKNPEDWTKADWSDGCLRNVQLECGNGDSFLKYTGVKLPDTRWSWYNMSMSLGECKDKCLKDCNCTAYSNTDIRNGGTGCLLWFGDLNDMRGYSNAGQDLYVRMPASELKKAGPEAEEDLDLPCFGFMHIANVTNNFSSNKELGKGGFGTVYKGILEDGQEIAVKRLSKDSRQGVHEFMNEVSCIAKLQHKNLVRLLGSCIEEGERLLIY